MVVLWFRVALFVGVEVEVVLGSCANVGAQHDQGYSVESEYVGVGTLECTMI